MNSQQLILERIEQRIGETLILVNDRQYANTGTLRSLHPTTLEQIASVKYAFQDDYCKFGNSVASYWYGQSAEGKASWVVDSIPELVDRVVAHLKGQA